MKIGGIVGTALAIALLAVGSSWSAENSHTKLIRLELAAGVFSDFSQVNGSSAKLARSSDGVRLRVNTTGLAPGAYTGWWVIFNEPGNCVEAACNGFVDLGITATRGAVFFATGGIVRKTGVGYFDAYLAEGVEPPDINRNTVLISNNGNGLEDAEKAEIHFILRYHGPAAMGNEDLLAKQLETSSGGCFDGGFFQPPDPEVADRIFPCFDPQIALLPRP